MASLTASSMGLKADFLEAQALELVKESGQDYDRNRWRDLSTQLRRNSGERFNNFFWHEHYGPMPRDVKGHLKPEPNHKPYEELVDDEKIQTMVLSVILEDTPGIKINKSTCSIDMAEALYAQGVRVNLIGLEAHPEYLS